MTVVRRGPPPPPAVAADAVSTKMVRDYMQGLGTWFWENSIKTQNRTELSHKNTPQHY